MKEENNTFTSFDKQELFFRKWENINTWNKKVLIVLHRGHEHSKRLEEFAKTKAFENYKIYSYDNRGHGKTKIDATYEFMNLVRDLNSFVSFVCKEENIKQEDIFVIANSVAGVVASTWIHDYAPKIAGVALVAPAFEIKLYFPFAKEFLDLAIKIKPDLNIKSYVKSKFLTHDKNEQKLYDEDKLITPNIPARQLTTLLDTAKRVVSDAALISTPTLVLSASKDYVVNSSIQGDFYAKLSSKIKKFVRLDGFFHGVLYEDKKDIAINEIINFIELCFKSEEKNYLNETIKITQDEIDKIVYGSQSLCEKTSYFTQRFMLKNLGFMSDGMKKGLKYGFDSGVTLDYIYANKPSGKTKLGEMIDKNYLNSIGWKGIRQRKVNMISTLKEKIEALEKENKKIKILDIAGGPARYLIEICKQYPNIQVLVQDYQEQNINEGKQLAKEFGIGNIAYKQADAFDKNTYSKDIFEPNIVVVSGVFELFSSNDLIKNAIEGITAVIEDEGYLVYTGQPWHPQLAQIANVLGNHRDKQWIMRRRSQYELDLLFNEYNFEKENMKIDDWGIFTVSSAKFKKSND